MNWDESKVPPIVARGNNKSMLSIMHVFLMYRALFGEEKFKEFLKAIDKNMKKDGQCLTDYIKLEEPK